ncbi:hypothetical protein NM208_g10576 [Fusarium decemcellulare]|uniref:Uncharacterized protein n=1 Tax=Fusarium decemcellulare TaxID=57161 RepID=A0ACC1RXE0_9HYPO|nr:hypothetical protein NM208_g10576 [Fusarium decemcellulare]
MPSIPRPETPKRFDFKPRDEIDAQEKMKREKAYRQFVEEGEAMFWSTDEDGGHAFYSGPEQPYQASTLRQVVNQSDSEQIPEPAAKTPRPRELPLKLRPKKSNARIPRNQGRDSKSSLNQDDHKTPMPNHNQDSNLGHVSHGQETSQASTRGFGSESIASKVEMRKIAKGEVMTVRLKRDQKK